MKLNLNHTSETQLNPFVAFWDFWRSLPYPRAGDKNIFVAFLSFYFFCRYSFLSLFIRNRYTVLFSVLFVTCMYVCVFCCFPFVFTLALTPGTVCVPYFLLFTCYVCIFMCVWMCIYGFRESVCCFVYTFKWCAVVIDRIAIFVCLLCIFFVIV